MKSFLLLVCLFLGGAKALTAEDMALVLRWKEGSSQYCSAVSSFYSELKTDKFKSYVVDTPYYLIRGQIGGYITLSSIDPKNSTYLFFGYPSIKWEKIDDIFENLFIGVNSMQMFENKNDTFVIYFEKKDRYSTNICIRTIKGLFGS